MKLIKVSTNNFVVVEENTSTFLAGDFVLVNCSEINIKNQIKQIIEFDHKKRNVNPDLLVFDYSENTETIDAIDKAYCQKIIYSTQTMNGVKFMDANYFNNLVRTNNLELNREDLIKLITDFYENSSLQVIDDFVDNHPMTELKKDTWDVEIKNNYIVLKEEKPSDSKVMLEIDDYYKIMNLLQEINSKNWEGNVDPYIDRWSGQITTILQNSFIKQS